MLYFLMVLLSCAVLYAIKGGQHRKMRLYLEHKAGIEHHADGSVMGSMTIPQWLWHRFLDGKLLSAFLFGILFLILTSSYQGNMVYTFVEGAWWKFLLAVGLWLAAVSPKMGRIAGMIGGYKGNWDRDEDPYDDPIESALQAAEGWKQGLQRGVFIGAMMALLFWNPLPILFGALYPATLWAGISIEQFRTKTIAASWVWHEMICGAVCFGLPIAIII